jgi:signal transduction histidine kinase
MRDDDIYARHQTLAALVSVLLHDLRNPLHSATLLVEAMGSRTADVDALRGRLRAQFAKLDGLISEAAGPIRELTIEPRIEDVALDDLCRMSAEVAPSLEGVQPHFDPPSTASLKVTADRVLLSRAIGEIAASIASQTPPLATVTLTVDQPDAETARIALGNWKASSEDTTKSTFAIAGGGIRLALARSLAQNAGGTLRLERAEDGSRFALLMRRAQ